MKEMGFTLIELLIVIAIVGLLVSIIVLNARDTKFLAHDAQIQTLMHQLRNAAELDYNRRESYSQICDESDDTLRDDNGDIEALELAIEKENGGSPVRCYESEGRTSFAASSPLRTQAGKSWCVQSAGFSRELDCSQITSAVCQCP